MRGNFECQYDFSMTPSRKARLTVTVDPELIEAGNRAVAAGTADSMSAWVSAALADRQQRDEQLTRLRSAIADYEAEFGEITPEELATQSRADRANAIVVRGKSARRSRSKPQ